MTDLYDDLPHDLKGMVDDYSGPRTPGKLEIAKEVFSECMCGGVNYNYAKKSCKWCSDHKSDISNIFRWIAIITVILITLFVFCYLFGFPISNLFIGLMFSDMKCKWYSTCETYGVNMDGSKLPVTYYDYNYSQPVDLLFTSTAGIFMGLLAFILSSIIVGLLLWVRLSSFPNKYEKRRIWFSIFCGVYLSFVTAISLAFYFSLAKMFGAYHDPEKCTEFVELPFVYWYYHLNHPPTHDHPWGYTAICGYNNCCPFKRLGFLQGIQYDPSLPWDVDGCTKCIQYGWKYLPIFIVTPIVVTGVSMLIFLSIRRCFKMVKKVNGKYYTRV